MPRHSWMRRSGPWNTWLNTTRNSDRQPPASPRWDSCSTTSPPNWPATRPVRKYAPSIDEVLEWAENARARFDELQGDSTRIENLEAEVARASAELKKQAAAISKVRAKAAKDLSARVSAELKA